MSQMKTSSKHFLHHCSFQVCIQKFKSHVHNNGKYPLNPTSLKPLTMWFDPGSSIPCASQTGLKMGKNLLSLPLKMGKNLLSLPQDGIRIMDLLPQAVIWMLPISGWLGLCWWVFKRISSCVVTVEALVEMERHNRYEDINFMKKSIPKEDTFDDLPGIRWRLLLLWVLCISSCLDRLVSFHHSSSTSIAAHLDRNRKQCKRMNPQTRWAKSIAMLIKTNTRVYALPRYHSPRLRSNSRQWHQWPPHTGYMNDFVLE